MDLQKGSSDGEDIPSDFFDDFGKEDFIEGLSVVDEWDNDEPEKSKDDAKSSDDAECLRRIDNRKEDTERLNQEFDGADSRRSRSQARMDDFIKPGSRRDPNKTNEAIKRDKELKVKQHIAKHLESSEDLRPPGTELDDFYEENKKGKKEKELEEEALHSSPQEMREASSKISPTRRSKVKDKKRSVSPVRHRSPGKLHETAVRFYRRSSKYRVSPGRFRESPGRFRESPGRFLESPRSIRDSPESIRESPRRFRESPGRFRHGPGRFRGHGERHRHFGSHHESPLRFERHMYSNRKSPSFYRYVSPRYEKRRRSRSPHHYTAYRKERRYQSPHASPTRMSRQGRLSRSPRHHYKRSRSRSPRNSSEYMHPHKEFVTPHSYAVGSQPPYPAPANFVPGMPVNSTMPQTQYNVPQPYPNYNPYPYDINPLPQPVPAPVPAPGNPGLASTLPSPQQLGAVPHTTHVSTIVAPTSEPTDALAKLVADGILSHEDYLKLAPNKGALQPLDMHAKIDVLKRCHSAVSKLDELMPSNRLIVGHIKKTETPKSIAPKFFSPLKKKPIAAFQFTEINASAIALQNKQIIETIVSTLDLHDVVGRTKKNFSNMKDAAVQTISSHCDKCVIREATSVNEVGTSIDQEHFSSSTHTQVVEEDLHSSKSVFNASGSTSDGSAPISFAHMTPAQLVSQLVARAKTFKQSDSPSDRLPNQYHGRNHYDDRRDPPSYRSNYNQYRY